MLLMPPSKTLPQANRNSALLPNSIFLIFFPEQKEGGEDYVVEKIAKINKGIGHKFW